MCYTLPCFLIGHRRWTFPRSSSRKCMEVTATLHCCSSAHIHLHTSICTHPLPSMHPLNTSYSRIKPLTHSICPSRTCTAFYPRGKMPLLPCHGRPRPARNAYARLHSSLQTHPQKHLVPCLKADLKVMDPLAQAQAASMRSALGSDYAGDCIGWFVSMFFS